MSKALSTFQVAKLLGVSPPTVIKWTNDGLLKSFRTPGGHRRILESDIEDFLGAFGGQKQVSTDKSVLVFAQDEAYAQLLEEFFDCPQKVFVAQSSFQLGWVLAQQEISHLVWDWYDNAIESLKLLSTIRKESTLSHLTIIGIVPLYEQLNPSFGTYFDFKTNKNMALQNLNQWVGSLEEE